MLETLRNTYIWKLSQKGYITAEGRIRFSNLLEDFTSTIGPELLPN